MKSLKIILTIAKIFSILALIGFIFSIVGACFSLIGVSILSAIREDSELWQKITELSGATLSDLNAARCASLNSVFYCAENAILCGFSKALFKHILSVGTPFDKGVSKRMLRDGILNIAIPIATIIITSIISAAFGVNDSEAEYVQLSTGFAYLFFSLVCSYGAEVKEVADRNLNGNNYGNPYNGNNQDYGNGNNQSNPYDDFHNPY